MENPEKDQLLRLKKRNLKLIRVANDLTQKAMADIFSISEGAYGKYERGERALQPHIVEKLKNEYKANPFAKELQDLWLKPAAEKTHTKPNEPKLAGLTPDPRQENVIICPNCQKPQFVSEKTCRHKNCEYYFEGCLESEESLWRARCEEYLEQLARRNEVFAQLSILVPLVLVFGAVYLTNSFNLFGIWLLSLVPNNYWVIFGLLFVIVGSWTSKILQDKSAIILSEKELLTRELFLKHMCENRCAEMDQVSTR